MALVNVCSFKDTPKNKIVVNTTSRSKTWGRELSPFLLGPIKLYDDYISQNVENAWQYSKVYHEFVDEDGNPSSKYFEWANHGWNKTIADRYPAGKGRKPLYSYWNGQKLSYIEARRKIYAPIYSDAVENTEAYQKLKKLYFECDEIWLWDFDGYDFRKLNMSFQDVMESKSKKWVMLSFWL